MEEEDDEGEDLFVTPTSDLLFILTAQSQLDEISRKFATPGYSLNDDDRTAVLQLLSFSFKPTAVLLAKMSERFGALRALRRRDRTKAAGVATEFAARLQAVEQSCRDRATPSDQVAVLRAASDSLGDFLAIAETKFVLPKLLPFQAPLL